MPNGRRPDNSSGKVLAVVASLLIGAAGAYGYMRYSHAADHQALQSLQEQRDSLMEQVKRQSADLDEMTLRLMALDGDKSKDSQDAERQREQEKLSAVLRENERLNERLSNAEKAGADGDRTIAQLRQRIGDLQADGTARNSQIAHERDRLRNEEVPRLKQEIAKAQDEIASLTADLSTARSELTRQQTDAKVASQTLADVQGRLQRSEDERRRLQAELEELRTAAKLPETDATADDRTVNDTTAKPRAKRDETAVDAALDGTPDLDRLSEDQRLQLKAQLVEGACVTTALGNAFGRVPLITLRNMIRDLNSDC